jgi:hypothetical protein
MIEVKLTFASQAALLAFFAGTTPLVSADEKAAVASITAPVKEATTKPGKPAPAPAAASSPQPAAPKDVPTAEGKAQAPAATQAATGADQAAQAATAGESPSEGKPAAAATSDAPPASSSKPGESAEGIDYAVLQKAVFALAGKSRETMVELCAARGVKTFKELDPSLWGAALAAVNAALVKLG